LSVNQKLIPSAIQALQRFTLKPARYTEASLVKKLEELGIGRPSTYAPTITTIQQRDYVVKEDREGTERSFVQLILKAGNISREEKTEITGTEKSKLFPTDIGLVVNDFLMKHFEPIVDFYFTATVEKQFDEIAEGSLVWQKMIDDFYLPFHRQIEDALANSERARGERFLGIDPATGKNVSAKIGRFGPFIQLGDTSEDGTEKPVFASLQQGQSIETISLEQGLKLFDLPRDLGEYEGKKVTVGIGKFGPYAKHDSNFVSLKKGFDDPYTILIDRAIELILERREKISNSLLKTFEEDAHTRILQGRWGPYISHKKLNFKLKKDTNIELLTYAVCKEIIDVETKKPKQKKSK
jgi:DNA topoisomerase-1